MTEFQQRVRAVVASIPYGETRSYAEVATLAGFPGASRAVGSLMKANMDPSIPCHRVVLSSGRPGDYNRGGESKKREILMKEREECEFS